MRPFILIDLYRQMPCLPLEMRTWPRERVLGWMALFGAVIQIIEHAPVVRDEHLVFISDFEPWFSSIETPLRGVRFIFRSRAGMEAHFLFPDPGNMYVPGTRERAWSAYDDLEPD